MIGGIGLDNARVLRDMLLGIGHKVAPLRMQRESRWRRVRAVPSLVWVVIHFTLVVEPPRRRGGPELGLPVAVPCL